MRPMTSATVTPLFTPSIDAMTAHVEHLFGGHLGGFHNGLVELAWTDTKPDGTGRYRLSHARLYSTDQLDDLVTDAARLNTEPMCNVYIGAALRKPDTAPFGRTTDTDVLALPALYADLDDSEASARARDLYQAAKPSLVVLTGKDPHKRAQLWWRLDEPSNDPAAWRAHLERIGAHLAADMSVCNPSRVMRLAGSIAWPVKQGRVVELTEIVPLKSPGLPVYRIEQILAAFPERKAETPPRSEEPPRQEAPRDATGGNFFRTANTLALQSLGSWVPDLFGSDAVPQRGTGAWRVSSDSLGRDLEEDLSISPQGIVDFGVHDMGDPRRGKRTPIDLVMEHGGAPNAKEAAFWLCKRLHIDPAALGWGEARKEHDWTHGEPAASRGQEEPRAGIPTVDFLTLMTEGVVEEPDYIEPNFAGPGGFVLIAGPPKAQKSFLLQEMLVAAATGDRFLCGTFSTPRPLRVFYLQAEMNRKLLRKRAREMAFLTPAQRDLLQKNLIVSERFHMILDENGVDVAVATIAAAFPDAPPDIIAIDPMANVFDQENENDNAQVMRFLNGRLQAVRQRINPLACVVLVHHATKKSTDDMARDPFVAVRGAGALRGYYDSAIVIYREGEESRSRKVHFELRGGESPEPMSVELAGGRFQKADEGSSIDKATARKILDAMRTAWTRKAPWSPHARAKSEGRWAVYNASTMFSVPPKAVQWLLDEWLKNGVVTFRQLAKREHPAGLEVTGSID